MPLSSNTLIHFTDSKDKLKKILEENFRIFYCEETINMGRNQLNYCVPMVSFCDIPLSEVKEHISKYGSYGLGMTKEWGKKMGLNPVLYIAQESMLSYSYYEAAFHFAGNRDAEIWSNEEKAISDVLRYMKNYEADLLRKGAITANYRFSDEREWRYVPHYTNHCAMFIESDPANKTEQNTVISDLRLEFEPNDIKYIIINDESEISEFIRHLQDAKGKHYKYDDVQRLTTRILTTEQIRSDM